MGFNGFEFNEIGKIGKSISIQEMKGNDTKYFRLTKLYKDDEGNWHPTKQGVSIPLVECTTLMQYLQDFINKNPMDGSKITGKDIVADLKEL